MTVSDGGRVGQGRYFGSRGGAEARRGLEVESKEGFTQRRRGRGGAEGLRDLEGLGCHSGGDRIGGMVSVYNWPFDTPPCGGYSGRTVFKNYYFS